MSNPIMPPYSLNPDASIEVYVIGQEKQPVFVVDNAVLNPEALVDCAANATFVPPALGSLYPGINAHLPPAYLNTIYEALQRPLTEIFNMAGGLRRRFGFFGLSTLSPDAMMPRQALPHTDSSNLNSYATVHFLNSGFGGTAFYRHKSSGFEVITATRSSGFGAARAKEIAELPDSPAVALEAFYEEIAYIEPVFNRLILYRATQLHSARLSNISELSADPRCGRLTANSFINT